MCRPCSARGNRTHRTDRTRFTRPERTGNDSWPARNQPIGAPAAPMAIRATGWCRREMARTSPLSRAGSTSRAVVVASLSIPTADNVYYVRSHVMSSQDGTEDPNPLSDDAPGAYAGGRVPKRDTEPIAALPDPGAAEMVRRRWSGVQAQEGHGMGGGSPLPDLPGGPATSEPTQALEAFYSDLLHELDELIRRPTATAPGFGVILKRVGRAHGVEKADRLPLPRLSREERESRSDSDWVRDQ